GGRFQSPGDSRTAARRGRRRKGGCRQGGARLGGRSVDTRNGRRHRQAAAAEARGRRGRAGMSPQNPACRRNWWSLLLSVLVMLASAVRGDDTVPARESAPQADARDSDADQQQPARQLLRGK